MVSKHVPKFLWPSPTFGSNLTLLIPSPPWAHSTRGVGGRDYSAAGVPEVFKQRRDDFADVVLRFRETDWPSIRAFVDAVSQGVLFAWYPDHVATPGQNYLCYLESPAIDEELRVERDDYPGILRAPMKLRFTAGAATADYFPTPSL